MAIPASASAQAVHKFVHCDFEYVIQQGDTLATISEAAYGTQHQQLIFARNSGQIDMLGVLPAGQSIIIPCAPGEADYIPDEEALEDAMFEAADVDAAAFPPVVEATPATPLRILTADGMAPYVDRGLKNEGFVTELVRQAIARQPTGVPSEIVFINDRSSHLRELLVAGSFDIGFPWHMPPCELGDALGGLDSDAAWMCENLDFSPSLYEYVRGVFTLSEARRPRDGLLSYAGLNVCVPVGDSTLALTVVGLTTETVNLLRPADAAGCVEHLIAGEADAALLDTVALEHAATTLGVRDRLTEWPELSVLATLHAVSSKRKPQARNALARLSRGIEMIKQDGVWFQVVGRFLTTQ